MKITLGKIIDKLVKLHEVATVRKYIQKPWSWALYQTWEWCNFNEKPREEEPEERVNV